MLMLLAGLAAVSARAQAASDTARSVPRAHSWQLPVGMAGGMAALMLAPPAILYLPKGHQDPNLGFAERRPHLIAFSAGGFSDAESGPNGWSWTEEVEARQGRVFGGYRHTTFAFARRTSVAAAQLGYTFRALDWAEGGVAVGYQGEEGEEGDRLDDGVTVALPMRIGAKGGTAVIEPTYRFSGTGVRMAWRFEVVATTLPEPLLIGFRVEAQEMRRRHDFIGTYALLLGVRR
jgi:hypothetical protein